MASLIGIRDTTERKTVTTILVPLTGFENDTASLEVGYRAAERLGGAIDVLHVCPNPMILVTRAALAQFTSGMGNAEHIHALQKDAETRVANTAAALRAFQSRHPKSAVPAAFEQIEGEPIPEIIAAARVRDMLALARPPAHGQFSTEAIGTILVGCGRPLLLAPDAPVAAMGARIAIAWKETTEAARAVTAAMPFLARAASVIVLTQAEGGDTESAKESAERLAVQLRRHGPDVTSVGLPAETPTGVPPIVEKAKEWGADLLVAGAYSHSRMRELVFGGFTRAVLSGCALPVLLVH
jgi:nucleotide-binding universal stress UspA family protein